MKSASRTLLSLSLLAFLQPPLPAAAAGAPAACLAGRFYEQDRAHPIAGALVALYEKGTGLLIDSTYTRDDGEFTLRAPQRGGAVYLVATKGDLSRSRDLTYDPARPMVDASIAYRPALAWWARPPPYLKDLYSKVEALAIAALGLLFGRWLARGDAHRKAAKASREYVRVLKKEVERAVDVYAQLYSDLPADRKGASAGTYRDIVAGMTVAVGAIRRQLDKASEEDLYEARGQRGDDEFSNFSRQLEGIEGWFTTEPGELTGDLIEQRLADAEGKLLALQRQPLLSM